MKFNLKNNWILKNKIKKNKKNDLEKFQDIWSNLIPRSWYRNNLIKRKLEKITKFIFQNKQLWRMYSNKKKCQSMVNFQTHDPS